MVNQFNRATFVTRIMGWLVFIGGCIVSSLSFFGALWLGLIFLPEQLLRDFVFVWDVVVLVFAFTYIGGVISELQRAEPLALDKFLHLPISSSSVFLLNYVGSSISLTLCTFVPLMLGLGVAMVVRYGSSMLAILVLIAVFFLMVTAVTHQFRGWIASLMSDKRRRRTLIAVGTALLVVASLTPMFINRSMERVIDGGAISPRRLARQQTAELRTRLAAEQITQEEFDQELVRIASERQRARQQQLNRYAAWGRMANAILPIGWLPHGIEGVIEQRWWTFFGCVFGMGAVAAFSLSRSYQTTLRLYRGGFDHVVGARTVDTSSTNAVAPTDATAATGVKPGFAPIRDNWLMKEIPMLSEHQAVVALATLRGLTRAPEAKLAIFFPIVILAILAGSSIFGQGRWGMSDDFQALSGLGICFFSMMGASQLIQNQFGFDRDGFRYFLLAPIRERDLLLGKNLALLPLALVLSTLALFAMQIVSPMRWTHFVATFFQLGTMFMVASLVGNLMSIYVPLAMKSGSLKPVNLKFSAALLQMLIFMLAPLGMVPAVMPLLVEWLLSASLGIEFPIYLLGSGFYLLIMVFVYRWAISWEGNRLHERKHKILDTVTHMNL